MEKRYLNVRELRDYMTLKPPQVYWLVFKRKIPFKKLGKARRSRLLFDKEEIDKWLKKGSITMKDIET